MNASAFKLALVAAIVAGSAAAPVIVQHRAQSRLEIQSEMLRQQTAQLAELSAENQRLSNAVARLESRPFSEAQVSELLRLRAQIGPLRKAAGEVEQLRSRLNAQH